MTVEGQPKPYSEAENLTATADFLNLDPKGHHMSVISGLAPEALSQILDGSLDRSERSEHIEALGEFTRKSKEVIVELTLKQRVENGLVWLEGG